MPVPLNTKRNQVLFRDYGFDFYFFWNEFLTRSFQLKSIEKAMVNLIDTLRSAPQEEGVLTQLLRLQRQKENILFGFAKTSPNAVPAGKEQL